MLVIENTQPMVAADPRMVGAAIKIIAAGAQHADDEDQRRAAGVSRFVWGEKADVIKALVQQLEG